MHGAAYWSDAPPRCTFPSSQGTFAADAADSSSARAADFQYTLGEGPVADTLRSLNLGKMLRYDYVPRAQTQLCAGAYA